MPMAQARGAPPFRSCVIVPPDRQKGVLGVQSFIEVAEELHCFGNLRCHYEGAVWLIWISLEVVMMIILCGPECFGRLDFSGNW